MTPQIFTNDHGQQPSEPWATDAPLSAPLKVASPMHRQIKAKHPLLQRMGHELVDTKRCQTPNASQLGYSRCKMPATHVLVENTERDGAVCAMSVCDMHHKSLLVSQPADYAKITPIEAPAP